MDTESFDFYLQTPCTQVHFLALSVKVNTGWFSCFVCPSFNFFVFLSLLRRASPAIFDFYLQTPCTQDGYLKILGGYLEKSNMLTQPFTRQENPFIQTCLLASSA
ncbi:hypothetical protein AAZX31_10G111200 [Glycine max]